MGEVRVKPLVGLLQWVEVRMLKNGCSIRVRESRLINSKNWGHNLYFLASGLVWELTWIEVMKKTVSCWPTPNSTCFKYTDAWDHIGICPYSSLAILFIYMLQPPRGLNLPHPCCLFLLHCTLLKHSHYRALFILWPFHCLLWGIFFPFKIISNVTVYMKSSAIALDHVEHSFHVSVGRWTLLKCIPTRLLVALRLGSLI